MNLGRPPTATEVAEAATLCVTWLEHGGWLLSDLENGEIVCFPRHELEAFGGMID